jgi:two-component system sensor histidine kinase VicK
MRLPKFKLSQKVLVISIITAIIPLIIANIYWYTNTQRIVTTNQKRELQTVAYQASIQINDFLNQKLLGLLSHSEGAALISNNSNLIKVDLTSFILQDTDFSSLAFANSNGKEIIKVNRQGILPESDLKDIRTTDMFKVPTFFYGKEYMGPVVYTGNGIPEITISVPVVLPQDTAVLQTFSSESLIPRRQADIIGVLIGTVKLTTLYDSISSLQIGKTGYLYIVDSNGKILAHPDNKLVGAKVDLNRNTEVKHFINENSFLTQTNTPDVNNSVDIIGNPVLSIHETIPRTGWAVIAELPISETAADLANVQQLAIPVFTIPLLLVLLLSIVFSQTITSSLKKLVKGIQKIGQGDFDYDLSINTGDELEVVAQSFHQMAQNLKFSQQTLQHDKQSIEVERNMLSSVLSNIGDGVIALDENHTILFFNKAALTILELHAIDILNKSFDTVVHLKEKEDTIKAADLAKRTDTEHKTHSLSFISASGKIRTITLTVTAIPVSPVTQVRYLFTFLDATKEQELEEMKLDFVSMAAHELRTPITSVRGYLSLLMQEGMSKLNDDEKSFVNRTMIATEQLMALVENLLSVSRIERNAFSVNVKEEDWVNFVKQIVSDLQNRAREEKRTLIFIEPTQTISKVMVDKLRIGEVLTNLINNAINYSPENSEIKVWVEQKDTNIVTHIQDHGEGIPAEALPHLFTKFFRVSGPLEQGSKGTGLGLFISKSIIEMHHGRIWVESELGKGSTFSFSLPAK